MTISFPKWFDLHVHFRQGKEMQAFIAAHVEMGCAGAVAMPNTQPPVSRVLGRSSKFGWTVEHYLAQLRAAGASEFDELIVPLYLTRHTTAEMILKGAESGLLRACKYYPPHATTHSEHGLPLEELLQGEVLQAMEQAGLVLCVHGEEHGLQGEAYFGRADNAESLFYQERMPRLLETYPDLRVVCEHITTAAAVRFVDSAPAHVGATITPQHLLYIVSDLIQGLKYHLYCLPVVKFEEDREALRQAAIRTGQTKYFAGTDSAPHVAKATECGCAAGCFTGGYAPQLYAMAFERAGASPSEESGRDLFERFLCLNGPAFYGFAESSETFHLKRHNHRVSKALSTPGGSVTPLPLGMGLDLEWVVSL